MERRVTVPVLSPDEIRTLQRVVDQSRNMSLNGMSTNSIGGNSLSSPNTGSSSADTYGGSTPDVLIAWSGDSGIDEMVDTFPGSNDLDIYKIVKDNQTYELVEAGFQKTILNLYPYAVPSESWLIAVRDKFGAWVVDTVIPNCGTDGIVMIETKYLCEASPGTGTDAIGEASFLNQYNRSVTISMSSPGCLTKTEGEWTFSATISCCDPSCVVEEEPVFEPIPSAIYPWTVDLESVAGDNLSGTQQSHGYDAGWPTCTGIPISDNTTGDEYNFVVLLQDSQSSPLLPGGVGNKISIYDANNRLVASMSTMPYTGASGNGNIRVHEWGIKITATALRAFDEQSFTIHDAVAPMEARLIWSSGPASITGCYMHVYSWTTRSPDGSLNGSGVQPKWSGSDAPGSFGFGMYQDTGTSMQQNTGSGPATNSLLHGVWVNDGEPFTAPAGWREIVNHNDDWFSILMVTLEWNTGVTVPNVSATTSTSIKWLALNKMYSV